MTTRDMILKVSLDLFINKGLQATSTKLILEAANISNGALYHHFSNKEEIVQELYYTIKDELTQRIIENTKGTEQFREFLWKHWYTSIQWSLLNPKKKLFLEMFSNTPTIRNCTQDHMLEKTKFIFDKIDEAIRLEIINVPDRDYFLYSFIANTDGVIKYLNQYPEKNCIEFLQLTFQKYWRLVVNF
ncbi:MAG: TetR/AcrR family transcriptional regulator [Vallitalea sp.]|jgi:AcrR family transcriptional regulator|nr:TetR/AcrR family transcriptional regulator [Vallitalea sp.]